MIDFLVTYYNPETLERDSNGVFGLDDKRFFGKNFIPLILDGVVNPKFIDFASKVQFFRCECDFGTASFRCEIRSSKKHGEKQYWYGYKRTNGKLKKFNIGDLTKLNQETIENAIAYVCGLNEVAQQVTQEVLNTPVLDGHGKSDYRDDEIKALKKEIWNKTHKINDLQREIQEYHREKLEQTGISLAPRPETVLSLSGNFTKKQLAGHGKNANQLQPDLIDCHEQLAIAQNEIFILNKMLKEALEDVATANAKEHEQYVLNGQLKGKLAKTEKTLQERDDELLKTHEKLLARNETIARLEDCIKGYEFMITQKSTLISERDRTIEKQLKLIADLNQECNIALNDLKNSQREVDRQQFFLKEKNEIIENLQNYNRIGEQEAFENLNTFHEVMPIIKKYRDMCIDKTKKGNPRYAYLIDFLADIDKLS